MPRKINLIVLVSLLIFIPLPGLTNPINLKFIILDKEEKPINGLSQDNFIIERINNGVTKPLHQFEIKPSPQYPTYLAILLDMSGSMKNKDASDIRDDNQDGKGIKKLQGALMAITELLRKINDDGLPIQVAILPFASPGVNNNICSLKYEIEEKNIKENFEKAPYTKTISILRSLETQVENICGESKIYENIQTTVKYLRQISKSSSSVSLNVILITDGSDNFNNRRFEKQRFEELKNELLNNEPQVKVYPIGYGEPWLYLRQKAVCKAECTDACRKNKIKNDLTFDEIEFCYRLDDNQGNNKIKEYIIDEIMLKEIADLTGADNVPIVNNYQDLIKALNNILINLNETYVFSYNPTELEQANSYDFRIRIKDRVNISNPMEIKVRTSSSDLQKIWALKIPFLYDETSTLKNKEVNTPLSRFFLWLVLLAVLLIFFSKDEPNKSTKISENEKIPVPDKPSPIETSNKDHSGAIISSAMADHVDSQYGGDIHNYPTKEYRGESVIENGERLPQREQRLSSNTPVVKQKKPIETNPTEKAPVAEVLNLDNEGNLSLLKLGVNAWNEWRVCNAKIKPNLIGADLRGADLCGADLCGADLRGADLSWTDLYGANLRGANLRWANLSWARLKKADLYGADLYGANLSGADSMGANLGKLELTTTYVLNDKIKKVVFSESSFKAWNPNIVANVDGAIHDYVDLEYGQQERGRVSKNNFPCNPTRLFQNINQPSLDNHQNTLTGAVKIKQQFLGDKFMAENASEYNQPDLRYAQISAFAWKAGNVTGGPINNYNYGTKLTEEEAAEIRHFLDALDDLQKYQSANEEEKLAIVSGEIKNRPTLKTRIINAIKEGGIEAFKQVINHPSVNILVAAYNGWIEQK